MTVRAPSVAALFVTLVACGPGDERTAATVSDSAGITIVESYGPAWNASIRWRLSPAPSLVIGVAHGDPEYELYGVFSVRRLSNDLMVVSNAGTSELRFFNISGRYLYSVGRKGAGRGEFEALGRVFEFSAGSLMVADRRLFRLSAFDSRGIFARSWSLVDGTMFVQPIGNFADGSFLLAAAVAQPDLNQQGVVRDLASYYRHTADGTALDTLGTFPFTERYFKSSADGVITMVARPFGRHASAAVGDTVLYVGVGERFEIGVYSMDGELLRLQRFTIPSIPVTDAHMEAYLASLPERYRRYSEGIPYPSTLPAYSQFLVDELGHLWVREFVAHDAVEKRWWVFEQNGRLLGSVQSPVNLTIRQIGRDYVLGSWKDADGIEYVHSYDLIKP